MSNIKLKDHYWETEGIYDTAQTATQKAINGEVVESARNIIKVQDTQPTSTYNKIWLPETVGDGVQVPTWAEYQELNNSKPNPNLLDNWYFAGGGSQAGAGKFPINQRGSNSYSASGYGIDRWKALSATNVSIQSGYTSLGGSSSPSYFGQIASGATMAAINGKKLTISLLTAEGILYTGTGVGGTQFSIDTAFGSIYHYPANNELFDFAVYNGSAVNVVAVKAEIGDVQTLAHQENGAWVLNEVPNYQEQLVRCIGSHDDSSDTYANIDVDIAKSVQAVDYIIDLNNMAEYSPYFAAGRVKMFRVKVSTLNLPVASIWGLTEVMYANGGNQFTQYFYSSVGIWRRVAPGDNTFGGWIKIDDSVYQVGDKIDIYQLQVTLSNSGGNFVEINVPTPRKIPNGVTLGLAVTNHWVRKLSDGSDITGYSITASKQTDHWLTLRFTMPSASLGARTPYVLHYQGNVVIS